MSTSGNTSRWIGLLAWIGVIFWFSTDSFSSAGTSRFLVPALQFLFPFFSPDQLEIAHAICRKAAHVLGYFILGVLAWRAISSAPLSLALVLAVAAGDEFHQSFVPSRTGTWMDVGYDLVGGMTGLLLMLRLRNETRDLPSHTVL